MNAVHLLKNVRCIPTISYGFENAVTDNTEHSLKLMKRGKISSNAGVTASHLYSKFVTNFSRFYFCLFLVLFYFVSVLFM